MCNTLSPYRNQNQKCHQLVQEQRLIYNCASEINQLFKTLSMGSTTSFIPHYFSQSIDQILPQTQSLQQIKTQLCLEKQQLYQFYTYFNHLDSSGKGYLQLDDLIYQFSRYDQNFVEFPYLEYLFTLIKKQKPNILFFQEFLTGITAFCLMNNESILEFVFDCIDQDDDNKITKNDIKKFLSYKNPKNSKDIFFSNFLPEIDKLRIKENQIILDFDQFRSNSDRLHFLIWPAYKLQQTLRSQILGMNAWFELYSKAQKREYEIKNNEKKEICLKEKLQILKTLQKKQEGPFFKNDLKTRKPFQVSTDINIQPCLKKARRNSCPYIKPSFHVDKLSEGSIIQN